MTRARHYKFQVELFLRWPFPASKINPFYFDIWRNDCQSGPAIFRRSMMFERRAEPIVNMYAEGFVQVGWEMSQRILFIRFRWFRKMNKRLTWNWDKQSAIAKELRRAKETLSLIDQHNQQGQNHAKNN